MKLIFNVEYQTTFGENLMLNIFSEDKNKVSQHKMTTLDGLHWSYEMTKAAKTGTHLDYYYSVFHGDKETRHEWLTEPHRLEIIAQKASRYMVYDHWLDIPEDSYMYSSAFTDCIAVHQCEMSEETPFSQTIRLKGG